MVGAPSCPIPYEKRQLKTPRHKTNKCAIILAPTDDGSAEHWILSDLGWPFAHVSARARESAAWTMAELPKRPRPHDGNGGAQRVAVVARRHRAAGTSWISFSV